MRSTTRRLATAGLVALLTGVVPVSSAGAATTATAGAHGIADDAGAVTTTGNLVGGAAGDSVRDTLVGDSDGKARAGKRHGKTRGRVGIEVLSNRADLVSGGEALVEITTPEGTGTKDVRVRLNGKKVTQAFSFRADGRLLGLVEGLEEGDNQLTAEVRRHDQRRQRCRFPTRRCDNRRTAVRKDTAKLTITNHPIGGPIFSGPQLQPWLCTTEANGLGPPTDEQCNAPTRVDFVYQSTAGGGLRPYDPENPPDDVAMTTTDEGETVPFVVRRERGALNRGIYDVAVLFDPDEPWEPWEPQAGWNGKILWPFGVAAGTVHSQGSPVGVLDTTRLGEGFMVATHSMNQHNTNLNTVVSAESVMMLQEHITETYGEIRYVIGQGPSGASIQQQTIANAYPGLLDGLLPSLSFPDTYTTGTEVVQCMLLNAYFADNPELWPVGDRNQATGHRSNQSCLVWEAAFSAPTDPTVGCGLPQDVVYDPIDNPAGVRCTAQDYMVNIWGRRAEDGFAKRPSSNIGVQYALNGLLSGDVTAEQFVDLNEEIGSLDIDGNRVPGVRLPSDPGATAIAYRSGLVNDARQLDLVPIIDVRGSENDGIHTNFHSWEVKERLRNANGHADNHVVFFSPGFPDAAAFNEAFALMDQWLTAIEADTSDDPLDRKIVNNKPAGAVDACFIDGQKFTDQDFCLQEAPFFGSPSIAAGGPLAHDIIECQLKPLDEADYPAGTFTPAQWERLEAAFPTGVCDWSQPAVDRQPSVPWLSYADGPGGQPLGGTPRARVAGR
jgi:hypothetical protein